MDSSALPPVVDDRSESVLSEWMTRVELAAELRISVETLRKWDARRVGPPYAKVGTRVMYRRESVRTWLRGLEVEVVERR